MALATFEDVATLSPTPLSETERARVDFLITYASGLVEDYCRRDLYRREGAVLNLSPPTDSACLPIPPRYLTALLVTAVSVDGLEVTDWYREGATLVRELGWGQQLVSVTGSWGYPVPPDALPGIVCAEVVRWLAQSPGAESERVGEVEVHFADAVAGLSLSGSTRASLRSYRRMAMGTLTLRREGPVPCWR